MKNDCEKLEFNANYTYHWLSDEDISIERLRDIFQKTAEEIRKSNRKNLSDINVICEEIFGKVLDKLFDTELIPVSSEISSNYVAVDLVDYEKKIAFQVTSRSEPEKIEYTVDKFKKHKMYKKITHLKVLVLKMSHSYQKPERQIEIADGVVFSYSDDIIFLKDLLDMMEEKAYSSKEFLAEIYDIVQMVIDSGRLRYTNIVRRTKQLKSRVYEDSCGTIVWVSGYGDAALRAFLPKTYDDKISCCLEFRNKSLENSFITIGEDSLKEDYFVSEDEFREKHSRGRKMSEEEMVAQFENIRVMVNSHTMYHIYQLFEELGQAYDKELSKINTVLGTSDFEKKEGRYLISEISHEQWRAFLKYAERHNYLNPKGTSSQNICDVRLDTLVYLRPYEYDKRKADIYAVLHFQENAWNKVSVFWEPGYCCGIDAMEGFDNQCKWKADFTWAWLEEKISKLDLQISGKRRTIKERLFGYKW